MLLGDQAYTGAYTVCNGGGEGTPGRGDQAYIGAYTVCNGGGEGTHWVHNYSPRKTPRHFSDAQRTFIWMCAGHCIHPGHGIHGYNCNEPGGSWK